MQIDVENPCVIMSQDKSREFLHSGNDKDKFKVIRAVFFTFWWFYGCLLTLCFSVLLQGNSSSASWWSVEKHFWSLEICECTCWWLGVYHTACREGTKWAARENKKHGACRRNLSTGATIKEKACLVMGIWCRQTASRANCKNRKTPRPHSYLSRKNWSSTGMYYVGCAMHHSFHALMLYLIMGSFLIYYVDSCSLSFLEL